MNESKRANRSAVMALIITTWALLGGVQAAAGIRVIHGGGGYAEMIALSYFQQLDLLITPCLHQAKACGISEIEEKVLTELQADQAFRTDQYHLEFGGETEGPLGHKFRLPLAKIYKSDGTPLSPSEIAINVLAAWLTQPSIAAHLGVLWSRDPLSLARRIFGEAKFDVESLIWKSKTLRVLNAENAFATLFLDEVDVTQDLNSALQCREGRPVLKALRGLHAEGDLAIGRIQWVCAETSYNAILVLERRETGLRGRVLAKSSCRESLEAR